LKSHKSAREAAAAPPQPTCPALLQTPLTPPSCSSHPLRPPPPHPQLDSRRWSSWVKADATINAVAVWNFANVSVEAYEYDSCYHGPLLQVGCEGRGEGGEVPWQGGPAGGWGCGSRRLGFG
jgi:hypothetical protein